MEGANGVRSADARRGSDATTTRAPVGRRPRRSATVAESPLRAAPLPETMTELEQLQSFNFSGARQVLATLLQRAEAGDGSTPVLHTQLRFVALELERAVAECVLRRKQLGRDKRALQRQFSELPDVYDERLQEFLLENFTTTVRVSTALERFRDISQRVGKMAVVRNRLRSLTLQQQARMAVAAELGRVEDDEGEAGGATGGAAGSTQGGGGGGGGGSVSDSDSETGDSDGTERVESPATPPSPSASPLAAAMRRLDEWEFNVWDVHAAQPADGVLALVGWAVIKAHGLVDALALPVPQLSSFLRALEESYLPNPFHNAVHGADVAQTMHALLRAGSITTHLQPHVLLAALVAALAHDVGHLGVNNPFLVSSGHELAIRYNDRSPLENMHCALTFSLMTRPQYAFITHLPTESRTLFRKTVIAMILATDNAQHGKYLNRLRDRAQLHQFAPERTQEDATLLLQNLLHAADVSNPAKPLGIGVRWAALLVQEFYLQGDQERARGLPVGAVMDRTRPVVMERFQAGFISAIVLPLYQQLSAVRAVDVSAGLARLQANLAHWKRRISECDAARAAAAAAAAAAAEAEQAAEAAETAAAAESGAQSGESAKPAGEAPAGADEDAGDAAPAGRVVTSDAPALPGVVSPPEQPPQQQQQQQQPQQQPLERPTLERPTLQQPAKTSAVRSPTATPAH